jgi:hypothetical protein
MYSKEVTNQILEQRKAEYEIEVRYEVLGLPPPPSFCASAITWRARVVFPEASGPYTSTTRPYKEQLHATFTYQNTSLQKAPLMVPNKQDC